MNQITLHNQLDGSVVQVTKMGPFEAARNGLRLTAKVYQLDDGTRVPIYKCDDGGEFLPAVVVAPQHA